MRLGRANGAAQANFSGALHHADQGDIGNAQGADDQRQAAEHQKHDAQVRLYFVLHAFGLQRHLHLERARVVWPQRQARLVGNEVSRADSGFNHHQARAGEAEIPLRCAFRDDH